MHHHNSLAVTTWLNVAKLRSKTKRRSVFVENEAGSLQYPVAAVLRRVQISLKHKPHAHRIAPLWRDVDRCAERVA